MSRDQTTLHKHGEEVWDPFAEIGDIPEMELAKRAQINKKLQKGPAWATPIQLPDGRQSFMVISTTCPTGKHAFPRPWLATLGCIEKEQQTDRYSKIYRAPQGFYLDELHMNLVRSRQFDPARDLRLSCLHCINDWIKKVQAFDPSLFVDLTKGVNRG